MAQTQAQAWLRGLQAGCRADGGPAPVVCLQDSVLAFWSHGMQGRSLDTNEVSGAQGPGYPLPCGPYLFAEDLLEWPQCFPPIFPGDPGDHR